MIFLPFSHGFTGSFFSEKRPTNNERQTKMENEITKRKKHEFGFSLKLNIQFLHCSVFGLFAATLINEIYEHFIVT